MSREKRSQLMGRIRGRDTTPERYVAALLNSVPLEFDCHDTNLPGRPDFSFPSGRVAVFVDGDFWHGWRFPVWSHKLSPFWREKIASTRKRDSRNKRKLQRLGWTTMRIWEHQVEQDVLSCIRRIVLTLDAKVEWSNVEAKLASMPPLKRRKRLPKP